LNFEFGLNQNPKATDILQLQLASIAKTFSVLSAEDSQDKNKNRVGTNRYHPLQFEYTKVRVPISAFNLSVFLANICILALMYTQA